MEVVGYRICQMMVLCWKLMITLVLISQSFTDWTSYIHSFNFLEQINIECLLCNYWIHYHSLRIHNFNKIIIGNWHYLLTANMVGIVTKFHPKLDLLSCVADHRGAWMCETRPRGRRVRLRRTRVRWWGGAVFVQVWWATQTGCERGDGAILSPLRVSHAAAASGYLNHQTRASLNCSATRQL